ncbi:chemotaxis protein CheW [Pleurocapsa sp. PCC 7319]|uniref:chemotaxis protein CheW n=1 Tax=Pleurocapsa sp. PCC 7319 TaxID=118161 RepID=UPI000346F08B|nr:chemotaxis protein CheW [Pleurocapsa sp. PCC 7319]
MSDQSLKSSLLTAGEELSSQTEEEQFLKFRLHPNSQVMLPIKQITEVLKIQFGQIVPIPQMPSWVMGVYNWRGDILWMVDLGNLIGFPAWHQNEINSSNQTAIVLSPNKENNRSHVESNIDLGLVVAHVEDIELCDLAKIQPSPSSMLTPQLEPFLQGYWLKEDEIILVLDGRAIITAMPKTSVS